MSDYQEFEKKISSKGLRKQSSLLTWAFIRRTTAE